MELLAFALCGLGPVVLIVGFEMLFPATWDWLDQAPTALGRSPWRPYPPAPPVGRLRPRRAPQRPARGPGRARQVRRHKPGPGCWRPRAAVRPGSPSPAALPQADTGPATPTPDSVRAWFQHHRGSGVPAASG